MPRPAILTTLKTQMNFDLSGGLTQTAPMTSVLVIRSFLDLEHAWDRSKKAVLFNSISERLTLHSMAWMELRILIAKLIFTFDFEAVGEYVDWGRDVKSMPLWLKPDLWTKVIPREVS